MPEQLILIHIEQLIMIDNEKKNQALHASQVKMRNLLSERLRQCIRPPLIANQHRPQNKVPSGFLFIIFLSVPVKDWRKRLFARCRGRNAIKTCLLTLIEFRLAAGKANLDTKTDKARPHTEQHSG